MRYAGAVTASRSCNRTCVSTTTLRLHRNSLCESLALVVHISLNAPVFAMFTDHYNITESHLQHYVRHAMSSSSQKAALAPIQYNIGWITIKPESELVAARLMLDETHKKIRIPDDLFTYYPGKIGKHNVIISCSGEAGKHQAAECAVNMMRTRDGHNNNIAGFGRILLYCSVVAILLCCIGLGNIL